MLWIYGRALEDLAGVLTLSGRAAEARPIIARAICLYEQKGVTVLWTVLAGVWRVERYGAALPVTGTERTSRRRIRHRRAAQVRSNGSPHRAGWAVVHSVPAPSDETGGITVRRQGNRLAAMIAMVAIVAGACASSTATTAPTSATTAPTSAATVPASASAAPASPAPATTAAPSASITPPTASVSTAPSASAVASPTPAAATAAPSQAASGGGGTLVAHLYQPFHTFAPWDTSGTGGDLVVESLVWDMLAIYDEKGEVSYRVADSITPNADATEWTVKLKSGVKWSDGTPFGATDVLFSWKINANPDQSPNSALWDGIVGIDEWRKGGDTSKDIAGMTAPDDNTVVFKLKSPDGAFLSTLLNFRNMILPAAAMTADKVGADVFKLDIKALYALPFWQSPPVALGPYKWVKTETDQFIQFERNDQFYGGRAPFDTIILKGIGDFAVSATQLSAGDLDFAQVTLNDLAGLESAGFTTGTAVAPFPIESDYNTSPSSPMADKRVRQALMYGCDRQGFVDTFLQGKGQKIDSYFLPTWIPKDWHQGVRLRSGQGEGSAGLSKGRWEVRLQQDDSVDELEQGRPRSPVVR